MFLLEMGKTYHSIRLSILVMTRDITEGNNCQDYNKEYRAKQEGVIFVKIWQNQPCKTNRETVHTGSDNSVTGSQQHRQPWRWNVTPLVASLTLVSAWYFRNTDVGRLLFLVILRLTGGTGDAKNVGHAVNDTKNVGHAVNEAKT